MEKEGRLEERRVEGGISAIAVTRHQSRGVGNYGKVSGKWAGVSEHAS